MVANLLNHAVSEFGAAGNDPEDLFTPAEIGLLQDAATTGGGYLPAGKVDLLDWAEQDVADRGARDHHIRARLLRWLFLDQAARLALTPQGVDISGAVIVNEVYREGKWLPSGGEDDPLDLRAVSAPYGLRLHRCNVDIGVLLGGSRLHEVDLSGSRVGRFEAENVQLFSDLTLAQFVCAGPINLDGAEIRGDLNCENATFKTGTDGVLFARSLEVRGSVYFHKATINRRAYLQNSRIGGDLSFNDASINASHLIAPEALDTYWQTLTRAADNGGNFEIDEQDEAYYTDKKPAFDVETPFVVKGRREAYFRTQALRLDDSRIDGSLRFEGFSCDERVRAKNCKIGGDVEIIRTNFQPANQSGDDIYLKIGKVAEKYAARAVTAGKLDPESVKRLKRAPIGERGLILTNSTIGQSLVWLSVKPNPATVLHLHLTRTRTFLLTPNRDSWPGGGNIGLMRFEYADLSNFLEIGTGRNSDRALAWLEREQPRQRRLLDWCKVRLVAPIAGWLGSKPTGLDDPWDVRSPNYHHNAVRQRDVTYFQPQPYHMMARAMMAKGHQNDALDVEVEMERRIRESARRSRALPTRLFYAVVSLLLRVFIDYGYRPLKAFRWMLFFIVLSTLVFGTAYRSQLMSVTSEQIYMDKAYKTPGSETNELLPKQYIAFDAFLYSIDTFVPVLDFDQEARWFPNAKKDHELCFAELYGLGGWCSGVVVSAKWFEVYLNLFHIPIGWLVSTMFAFGVTGLAKRRNDDEP